MRRSGSLGTERCQASAGAALPAAAALHGAESAPSPLPGAARRRNNRHRLKAMLSNGCRVGRWKKWMEGWLDSRSRCLLEFEERLGNVLGFIV